MTHVASLHPVSACPDPEIVSRLEGLLAMAKRGEITSFVATMVLTSSRVGYSYDFGTNPQDLPKLVVGLERMKGRAIALFEEAVDEQ